MKTQPTVRLIPMIHRGQNIVKLEFGFHPVLQQLVKKMEGVKWTKTHRSWYVPEKPGIIKECLRVFGGQAWVDYSGIKTSNLRVTEDKKKPRQEEDKTLSDQNRTWIEQLKVWMRVKRYSYNSVTSYSDCLNTFGKWCGAKSFAEIGKEDILKFNQEYIL